MKLTDLYFEGNFQTDPTIFFMFSAYFFLNHLVKPQTTNALPFFIHIVLAIGGVMALLPNVRKLKLTRM